MVTERELAEALDVLRKVGGRIRNTIERNEIYLLKEYEINAIINGINVVFDKALSTNRSDPMYTEILYAADGLFYIFKETLLDHNIITHKPKHAKLLKKIFAR